MPVPRPRRAALAAVCAALCAVLCAAPSLGGGAPNLLSVAFNHDRPRQADDPLSPVDADMGQVAAVRARLAAEPDALVWMEGHASLVGSASYNLALAERRARYLLNGLGVASRAARGEDYSAGCKKVGAGVVTCGELHATGNAASSRRVDVHFVPKPAEDKPKGGPQQEEQQDDEVSVASPAPPPSACARPLTRPASRSRPRPSSRALTATTWTRACTSSAARWWRRGSRARPTGLFGGGCAGGRAWA